MFERFTPLARRVVVLSQEEARRLNHNYIGTEHILLGLLGEPEAIAYNVLRNFGLSLEGVRLEVRAMIGEGHQEPGKHIPFTPRAKKILELSLREALQLRHEYIGTEHILLGMLREGDGVAAQIMRRHADLSVIRTEVFDQVHPGAHIESGPMRRWVRARHFRDFDTAFAAIGQPPLSASPAADATLTEAARLAGTQPVGSHHLLLAALTDPDSAAARALAALGVDLDQAKTALRGADVMGTSDEQPEEAGRRQMVIRVGDDRLTIEAADPVIVAAGKATLQALGDEDAPAAEIRGNLHAAASLGMVWQALQESLAEIQRIASEPDLPDRPDDRPDRPGKPEGPEEPGTRRRRRGSRPGTDAA